MIHVCSLAALSDTVKATGASHVLTVMANVAQVQRPESVLEANHLRVQMDDITEHMDGFLAPSDQHSEQVLNYVRGWDRSAPLVVHCYAGISRSTASAFAAACMLNPHRDGLVPDGKDYPFAWLHAEEARWFSSLPNVGEPFPEWLR